MYFKRICCQAKPDVLQIYAPLEGKSLHRTLYVFTCSKQACQNNPDSWHCLKGQKSSAPTGSKSQVWACDFAPFLSHCYWHLSYLGLSFKNMSKIWVMYQLITNEWKWTQGSSNGGWGGAPSAGSGWNDDADDWGSDEEDNTVTSGTSPVGKTLENR